MERKKNWYNVMFGFGSQFVIIALGMIVPRVVLKHYGSDTNGFTSSIRQIFVYMALLEAGIGQSTLNSLYGPVARNDRKKISQLFVASRKYYRKVTVLYALLVILMAFLLPGILKTEIPFSTAFFVILFEGLSSVISFYYLETWKQLLSADGRYYIIQNINMVNTICSYGIKIILASFGVNIAIIQISFFVLSLVQMGIYKVYCATKYSWIDFNETPDNNALRDRYSFMISQVATTVFSSTDMIVLSVFCSTAMASVYSIYGLIYNNLNNLLNAVYFGLVYMLGQTWSQKREQYEELHDTFDGMSMWAITSTMSVAYLLTIPFVKMYTDGVTDINYIYTQLPLLFALIQILSWSRYVSGNLTAIAGFAKAVSKISAVEAAVNLILSIVLVRKYGIVGTLFATVIALPIKVIYCLFFSNRVIMGRGIWRSLKILLLNYALFMIVVFIDKIHPIETNDIKIFLLYCVVVSFVIYPTFLIINCACNQSIRNSLKRMVKRKK